MAISKRNDTAWDNVASVSGVAKASVANVIGVAAPSGSSDIVIRDVTTSVYDEDSGSVSSITVNLPSAGDGDFVIVILGFDWVNSSDVVTTPSGWTRFLGPLGTDVSDAQIYAYYRAYTDTASSTEAFAINSNLGNRGAIAWSFIAENIDTSDPVGNTGSAIAAASSVTAPAVTATKAGTFFNVVAFDGSYGDPFSFSNSSFTMTVLTQLDAPSGGDANSHISGAVAHANIGAGVSTNTTVVTAQASDGILGVTFVLNRA